MTRTLIISDPHGNQAALQKVLDHAYERFRPTEVWCLGDIVGYGPDPYLIWHTLRNEPIPDGGWLAGNHDWGLVDKLKLVSVFNLNGAEAKSPTLEIRNFREKAAAVLAWQQDILEDKLIMMQHLLSLPVMSQPRPGVYLTHGSFESNAERAVTRYLVTVRMQAPGLHPDKMAANFEQAAAIGGTAVRAKGSDVPPQLFAFGHNHMPGLWCWQDGIWRLLDLDRVHPLGNLASAPVCLNPGSVGFPRNGLGCPSYAFIDWQGDAQAGKPPFVTIQFVSYDASATRVKMQELPYRPLLDESGFLVDPKC